jgi:DNA polymerase
MELFTLDFESFYSRTFSLSKLTYDEYINDDQFEVIGVGVKRNSEPTQWFSGTKQETHDWLAQFDLDNNAVIMHNAMFDASILAFHFGIYPKVILDTLAMARALHGATVGNSLKRLAEYYGVGEKGTEVHNFIDYRRDTFTPQELAAYGEYCKQDVNLTKQIFDLMRSKFNQTELKLIDMTIRMYTEPKFMYDREFLVQHLKEVQDKREGIINEIARRLDFIEVGISNPDEVVLDVLGPVTPERRDKALKALRSNPKFAELLRSYGVEPPMKTSPATGKDTYALAKTDEGMKALLEHENPDVQALAAARLGVKSSLEETRTQRLIDTGDRNNGYLPIGLNYYAARSGRWGGTQQSNWQNIPRDSGIKLAIVPPPGYVVIGADLSNIELRVGLWLAGQWDKLQLLQEGKDLYKDFASSVFNVPYDEVNKDQRFIAKTAVLSLLFGSGHVKLREAIKTSSGVDIA